MTTVNKVIVIGHLGRDPETRTFDNGDTVVNMAIATSETWKDKITGEKKELTEWHRVSAKDKLAEICGQYLRKGSLVYIDGRLRTRKWIDKDGIERYSTEIRADQMRILGGRKDDRPSNHSSAPQQTAPQPQRVAPIVGQPSPKASSAGYGFESMDDEIPFRDPLSYRGSHLAI